MTSANWVKTFEFETKYPADSVEFCPIQPFLNYFVCGTYYLLEDDKEKNIQERIGSILLFKITKNLEKLQEVECHGILDLKWCPYEVGGKILIGSVSAKGDVDLYMFDEQLKHCAGINVKTDEEGDYMALALNWNSSNGLCVSDNKGSVILLAFTGNHLNILNKWKAHDLETWTVAFDAADPFVVYSGGDDAKLKMWDTRDEPELKSVCSRHDSGVTIVQTDTNNENKILTGSFDEVLKLWDTRRWKTPVEEVTASGGVWRLKRNKSYYLSANIYGGFQIFDFSTEPTVVADYKEHSSLAYGADWCHHEQNSVQTMLGAESPVTLLATCSFYDKRLTVSVWDSNVP